MSSFYEQLVSLWPALGGIPPFALYLFLALMLAAIALLIKGMFFRKKEDDPYELYKKDRLFRVDWTWEYKKKVPFNITCHCPTCHNVLYYDEHRSGNDEGMETSLECETCDRTIARLDGTYTSLLRRLQGHIGRKIATGQWKEGEGEEK